MGLLRWARPQRVESLIQAAILVTRSDKEPWVGPPPRTVFSFWDSDNGPDLPPLALAIVDQWRRALQPLGWIVNVLRPETLESWCSGAKNLFAQMRAAHLPLAHFSDWLRLRLLANYGGVWLDCTVLFPGAARLLPLWRGRVSAERLELFALRNEEHREPGGRPVLESWLLVAPRGSPFVLAWLKEFEEALMEGHASYCRRAQVSELFRRNLPGTYWTVYYAQQEALRIRGEAYEAFGASEDSAVYGFSLHRGDKIRRGPWQPGGAAGPLLSAAGLSEPLVKITAHDRYHLGNSGTLELASRIKAHPIQQATEVA